MRPDVPDNTKSMDDRLDRLKTSANTFRVRRSCCKTAEGNGKTGLGHVVP